jgi:catechol 2,3-dioxygenase-like lactoylglutathione lyase family enzyme
MIKSIGTTAVVVSDAAKAAEWYREKLGLDVQGAPKEHWVAAGTKGSEPRLHLCQQSPLEKGNTGIAFLCDDVEKTYEDLSRKGVKFTKPPTKEAWGTYAMLADLDGNEFWLVEE